MKKYSNSGEKTKERLIKLLSAVVCVCVCVAFTPTFAFASENTGAGEKGTQLESAEQNNDALPQASGEQAAEGNAPAVNSSGNEAAEGKEKPSDDAESSDNQNGTEVTGDTQNGAADGEFQEETKVTKAVNVLNAGSTDAETADFEDAESPGLYRDAMPAITYFVFTVFKGIKKASLINKNYSVSFNSLVYEFSNEIEDMYTTYFARITLKKSDAEVSYDENHNVVLSWIFSGNVETDSADYYCFLDFDSFRQHNYKIPGYKYKGSASAGFYTDALGDGTEYEDYTDIDLENCFWLFGAGAVANQYSKGSCNAVSYNDNSPGTGDNFNIGLCILILCICAAGMVAAALTLRRKK